MRKFLATILVILTAGIAGCQFDPITTVPTAIESMGDWQVVGEVCLPIDQEKMHSIMFQLSDPITLVVGSGTIPAHTVPPGAQLFEDDHNFMGLVGRRNLFIFSFPEEIKKVEAYGWDRAVYEDGTPYWTKNFRPGPEEGLMYECRFEISPANVLFCEVQILHDFGE